MQLGEMTATWPSYAVVTRQQSRLCPPPQPSVSPPPPPFAAGDLANMDSLDPEQAAKLPNLMALRDAIYSTQFRK